MTRTQVLLALLPSLGTALVAGLGFVGVLLTQRMANSRHTEEIEQQTRAWTRKQRAAAYMTFLIHAQRLIWQMGNYYRRGEDYDEKPDPHWSHDLSVELLYVEVYGSRDAALLARQVVDALSDYDLHGAAPGPGLTADQACEELRAVIQRDLEVPPTALPSRILTGEVETVPFTGETEPRQ